MALRETGLERALSAWRRLLGADHVRVEGALLAATGTATFRTTERVLGVVRPRTTEEVAKCLKIANRHRVPMYPVSGGKNWGYGSRVPTADRCVLLDMVRMNAIVAFDEELAYVTVEPGVTFRQLQAFLVRRKSRLEPSFVGSSLDASLVGHAVERGWGTGPCADRFSHVSSLEVVLPTGERVRTGYARFRGSHAGPIHRWGLGPSAAGLFSQSSLGVVTRMTLWLTPSPVESDSLFLGIDSDVALGRALDAIRRLHLDGALREPILFSNRQRMIALGLQYPWEDVGGRAPLPEAFLALASEHGGLLRWNGAGLLAYPSREHRAPHRRLIRAALGDFAPRIIFRRVRREEDAALEAETPNLALAYFRKRTPIPADRDPDRDRCGFLFCSPIVPLEGRHVRRAIRIIERGFLRRGFDPVLAIASLTERAALVNSYLIFDRDAPGEDARALTCFREVARELARAGYYPYRMASHLASAVAGSSDRASADFLATLKATLDPNRVLAPGRYEY